jgi:signal transduction histidine kinase
MPLLAANRMCAHTVLATCIGSLERRIETVAFPVPPHGTQVAGILAPPSPSGQARRHWHDPVLRIAFLVVGVLILYELAVTLLHPVWSIWVTDWFRALLAWPELLVIVFVSYWLTRARQPGILSAWLLSAALLSYTIARNLWTLYDRFIYPNHVPFPTVPDLFFVLQYPFFILALVLLPGAPPWGPRLKVILDCMLLMGAGSALSWYFVLAPIYLHSAEPTAGKMINLAYPIGDLCILFGLTVAFIYRRCQVVRSVLALLLVAFICLIIADAWAAWILLYPSHVYQTGYPPDFFWNAFYLLVPLAGLVQLRVIQHTPVIHQELPEVTLDRQAFQPQDFKEVLRVLSPFVAAVLACAAIAIGAIISPLVPVQPLGPSLIIFSLLLLVIIRQGITVLENAQLRRKWATAQANEQVMSETQRRMEVFLGIAGHELKTPLTTVILSLQVLQRRGQPHGPRQVLSAEQPNARVEVSQRDLELPLQQAGRLNRLVNDLLDTSRIQAGRLELDLKLVDVVAIVRQTIEEQCHTFPDRCILERLPKEPVLVLADADRIGQVVTNYVTNALKYSQEDRPIEIGAEAEGLRVRVWVRDQGSGLSPAEQEHIWERFYRAPGVEIQSGSGVGLGLGLYISKTIIEQHQGQVGVQSAPGQGSTFWFTLPLLVSEEDG